MNTRIDETPENFHLFVLYEDNHILAVHKPAGLLVQGDASGRPNLLDLAKAYLKSKYNKPGRVFLGLVHRLDRQVGGVVVLARTSKAAARLSAQFRENRVQKVYWARVGGRPEPPAGECETYLIRQGSRNVPARPEEPGARAASLSYRTLAAGLETSLVEIELHTGRRHQIRAQLAALGHPILGDRKYGSTVPPLRDAIALSARRLTFEHPTLGRSVTIEARHGDPFFQAGLVRAD
ncbi:MAG: RNA pseudouridine synthase [Proteobacteria bacterium]|nr:RNA pseudouridine synthase [Pseudomonadota bacterium]